MLIQTKMERSLVSRLQYEGFEDTKGLTKIHISKKNRQHNGQSKKENNDIQFIHINLKIG
jgi:hypothetical protein